MTALTGNDPGSNVISLLASLPAATPAVSVHLHTCGPWQIIEVNGEMDIQVLPLLPSLRNGVAAHVVFDLLGVTFMDACALGALVGRQQGITRSGGCMRLVAPSPVLRLLGMTGTRLAFPTFNTLERALHNQCPPAPRRTACACR